MIDWRIGCSGFYYKEWKEIFYPAGMPQKDWFGYYCQQFNTVEINATFYRMPSLKTLESWYDKSSPDFLFSVKAPRQITHYNKFNDTESITAEFYAAITKGLKDKLGCILFQLPPSLHYDETRMKALLKNLDKGFNNVVEARHKSWWREDVIEQFSTKNITFSGISYPSDLPDDIIQNTSMPYYRYHGKPILYKSLYPKSELTSFIKEIDPKSRQVSVYFNNTWGASAITNARQLLDLLKK